MGNSGAEFVPGSHHFTVKIARIFLGEHACVPECDGFSHTINNYPMEGTIQNGTILFLGGLFYGVSFTHSFFEVTAFIHHPKGGNHFSQIGGGLPG